MTRPRNEPYTPLSIDGIEGPTTEDQPLITKELRTDLTMKRRVCCCKLSRLEQRKLLRALCYAVLTSGIAAWTNMLAKASVGLLAASVTEEKSSFLTKPLAWLIISAVIPAALLQLSLMASMFSSFEAILIVPIFQSTLIFGLILEGAFYFQDFVGISLESLLSFLSSLVMCILGVFLLA